MLYRSIQRFKSQDILENMTVADFPQMGQKNRSSLHRKIFKVGYPEEHESKIVTTDDLVKMGYKTIG